MISSRGIMLILSKAQDCAKAEGKGVRCSRERPSSMVDGGDEEMAEVMVTVTAKR